MPALFSTTKLQSLSDWMTSHLLTDTCAIQRLVNNIYTTQVTSPCAVVDSPNKTAKDVTDESTGAVISYVLLPRNTVVYSPDRFLINGLVLYRVLDFPDPSTFEVFKRVQVVRFPMRGGAQ